MRGLLPGEFYVALLKDYDTKTFNVIAIWSEDDDIDDRTYRLIQQGRKVQIGVSMPQADYLGFHPENHISFRPHGLRYDPTTKW